MPLLVVYDSAGQIQGCAECLLVDELGRPNPFGYAVWVDQVEVSKGVVGRDILRELLRKGLAYFPTAQLGYWHRRDSTGSQPHIYSRSQIERYVQMEVMA